MPVKPPKPTPWNSKQIWHGSSNQAQPSAANHFWMAWESVVLPLRRGLDDGRNSFCRRRMREDNDWQNEFLKTISARGIRLLKNQSQRRKKSFNNERFLL